MISDRFRTEESIDSGNCVPIASLIKAGKLYGEVHRNDELLRIDHSLAIKRFFLMPESNI